MGGEKGERRRGRGERGGVEEGEGKEKRGAGKEEMEGENMGRLCEEEGGRGE